MKTFEIPVRVTGKVMYSITAETEAEAKAEAEELASEADFGVLEDIEWEAKPAVDEREANVRDIEFCSVWDGCVVVTSPAKLNVDTKEVFDIMPVDVSGVESLTREYIVIDGDEFPVFQESDIVEEDDEYWYDA